MMLGSYKLNRDSKLLYERCENKSASKVFRQQADYDLSVLRGAVELWILINTVDGPSEWHKKSRRVAKTTPALSLTGRGCCLAW